MTCLLKNLRLSSLFAKPSRFLLHKLTLFFPTFHCCKSFSRLLLTTAVSFFNDTIGMDDPFGPDNDNLWDLFYCPPFLSPRSQEEEEEERHFGNERVYLVPYRWWKEAEGDTDRIESVLYTVSTDSDSDLEIVLHWRKEEDSQKSENSELEFSARQYALVTEGMWLRALKRYNDCNNAVKSFGSLLCAEDCLPDLFPLKLRIFVSWETNSLVAKISKKENASDFYKKACDIFSSEYNLVHIWDFSGKTTQFFINDRVNLPNDPPGQHGIEENASDLYKKACDIFGSEYNLEHIWDFSRQTSQFFTNDRVNLPDDSPGQPGKEVLLKLQVHGHSDSIRGTWSNEMSTYSSQMECSSHFGSVMMNESTGSATSLRSSGYRAVGSMGLAGLCNLGNTCFMNSAIQCLAHTPKLVDFFLGDYQKEINYENPLGLNGELALAFGDLLRKLWVPGAKPVAPRMFKMKLANFASQFSGYNQHDSQELLSFLLNGLNEDLNRVKCKPYHEVKDAGGHPNEELAEEYWQNHLACNDSIIVDSFQGQFRSTLVCSVCKKVSITFEPFMYLSLPLPSTSMRTMTLTVLGTDGIMLPSTITVTVHEHLTLKDLIEALSAAYSLKDDETFLVAEIYSNRSLNLLDDLSYSLDLIRDSDILVAYRLRKDNEDRPLVVFMHQHMIKHDYSFGGEKVLGSLFDIPVLAKLSSLSCGSDLCRLYLKLVNPFLMPTSDISDGYDADADADNKLGEDNEMGTVTSAAALENDAGSDNETGDDIYLESDFKFYLEDVEIRMNKPLPFTLLPKKLEVVVFWSDKITKMYDTWQLSSLLEVSKPQLFNKRTQESVSINKCLEAFLKEEPLGPDNMWYCPTCEKPQQATKRLDIWRLPEILVIHLKRFSYRRHMNKLDTFVDFPINDLDLSAYVAHKNSQSSNCYVLYAISCHYGDLGGGHYTAFVRYGHDKWYEFDDRRVVPIDEDKVKTPAAYVLFYKRV